jgi:hypothetical protein
VAQDRREEAVAAAAAEFETVAKSWQETVQAHKLVVHFRDISKEMLRGLLSDVWAGFYSAGLLQELIPPSAGTLKHFTSLTLATSGSRSLAMCFNTCSWLMAMSVIAKPSQLQCGMVLHPDLGRARCGWAAATTSRL